MVDISIIDFSTSFNIASISPQIPRLRSTAVPPDLWEAPDTCASK